MMKYLNILLSLSVCLCSLYPIRAQYKVEPREGYSPQIGTMVDMLEEIKDRITKDVQDLTQAETDYLFDEKANSIGALIMHLVATEAYYQVETLEGRAWNEADEDRWGLGAVLTPEAKQALKGKPIQHYLVLWDEIREKTLTGLKSKDDEWFNSDIDESMNYYWAWFHILEHQANHMGQIALIKNRLAERD
jgi:uncharacterized damage-inducible protein DinB